MSTDNGSDESTRVAAVRAAAERLAQRLRYRDAQAAAMVDCSPSVPAWWREGLAGAAIFGDGLLSLPRADRAGGPGRDDDPFSRPVTLFSAAEISMAAGGEYVPVAWLDSGESVVLVRDRGELAVVAVAARAARPHPDGGEAAEPIAESLVAFLDALVPQTMCRLADARGRMSIELWGERSLLVERDGGTERRDFATDDEVGEYVATFLIEALDAGMHVVACPARMRPLIAGYEGYGGAVSRAVAPEVRAHAAISRLLADQTLELIDGADLEALVDDAARFLERNARSETPMTRAMATRFANWLTQHPAVDDVYADDEDVHRALETTMAAAS